MRKPGRVKQRLVQKVSSLTLISLKFTDLLEIGKLLFLWAYMSYQKETRKKSYKLLQKRLRTAVSYPKVLAPAISKFMRPQRSQQAKKSQPSLQKQWQQFMRTQKKQLRRKRHQWQKTQKIKRKQGIIFVQNNLTQSKTTWLRWSGELRTRAVAWQEQLGNQYRAIEKKGQQLWQVTQKEWRAHLQIIAKEWQAISSQPVRPAKKNRKKTRRQTQGWLIQRFTPLRKRVANLTKRWQLKLPTVQLPKYLFSLPAKTIYSLLISCLFLASSFWVYNYVFKDLPSAQDLLNHQPIVSTKILDRNGVLLYSIYKDENRTIVPLSQVAPTMVQATVAIEDQHFYSHPGFDLRGILRAMLANLRGEEVQGGSTITQQLVKNTVLNKERTFRRKIREILVAITVDGTFSKDEIMEMYLNEVNYGGSTYGVEEAARRYFGKHANELSLAESAMLAGLPQAPTTYSPYGSHPERAYNRQAEVLRRMVEDGYISEEQAAEAKKEVLHFQDDVIDIKAPHFVMYVRELLAEKYGDDYVAQSGLVIRTSLDYNTQQETEKIVSDEVASLERLRISNGAALVTNPKTGEVLAMVGSKNYFDFANDGQVNVTLRPRQPGSSIKPITYAVAFERGKKPSDTIDDSPITYHIPGSPPYSPVNYDGKYHGRVTLRTALASSYNIPAVKTLAEIGINSMIDKAQEMGISTWDDRSRFGLSLTLGGGEVQMIDMAKAYGTFANKGETVDINPILEIKRFDGSLLYENSCAKAGSCAGKRTLSESVAWEISDVLSDNNARTPAFGPYSVLYIPGQQVAVKTGTTNNLRDNWAIGYTSDRVVATWVGNNDNTPMSYVASGITGASPIWQKIMLTQLDPDNPHTFATPEGLVSVQICQSTGTLPCRGCPRVVTELFASGSEPTQACNPNWFKKAKPQENRDQILDGVSF